MIALEKSANLLAAPPAKCLWIDHARKVLCFERANLLFVFNLSVDGSYTDFEIPNPIGHP